MGKLVGFFDPYGRSTAAFGGLNPVSGASSYQEPGLLIACEPDPLADRVACQPCLSQSPHANVIAWDGRLDNPVEVRAQTGLSVAFPDGAAALALASYETAGAC